MIGMGSGSGVGLFFNQAAGRESPLVRTPAGRESPLVRLQGVKAHLLGCRA